MKQIIFILFLSIASIFAQNNSESCLGIWFNAEKTAKIEITKRNNLYFGKIIWLKEPNDKNGKPKTDPLNPDDKLKTRPRLGMEIMWGFKYNTDGTIWEDGHIYDPNSGKTYSAQFTMTNTDIINLRGYVGFSWIGKTSTWTRAK